MKPWDSKNGYNVNRNVGSGNSRKDCCSKKSNEKTTISSTKQKILTKESNSPKFMVNKTSKDHSDIQKDKSKCLSVDGRSSKDHSEIHKDKNKCVSVDDKLASKRPRATSPSPSPPPSPQLTPRPRRVASLNAEAKVNIFFEKEEPKCYKRFKIENVTRTRSTRDKSKQDIIETPMPSIENEKNIPIGENFPDNEIISDCTTESESEEESVKKKIYKPRLVQKEKPVRPKEHRRRRVRDWFAPRSKKPQKKLLDKEKLAKANAFKATKKSKQGESNRKIIVEILPEEPRASKRMASLNAQAIIAVTNIPDRIMSPRCPRIIKKIVIPKLQKKLKEDKKIYDEVIVVDDSPKKRVCDPDIYEFVDEIEKPYDSRPSSRLSDIKEKHQKKILGQSFTPYTPSPPQTHLASSPHLMGSIPYTGHTTHIPALYPYHNGAIIPSAHCQTLTLSGMGSISSLPLGIHRHYGSAFSVPHYNHASHLSYVHEKDQYEEQKTMDQNIKTLSEEIN